MCVKHLIRYKGSWFPLPERNTVLEFEEHINILKNMEKIYGKPFATGAFEMLYKESCLKVADVNDIHTLFKDEKYKLHINYIHIT
jgi:hypothetical protein